MRDEEVTYGVVFGVSLRVHWLSGRVISSEWVGGSGYVSDAETQQLLDLSLLDSSSVSNTLRIDATPFQLMVYEKLLGVNLGVTLSYSELSTALGAGCARAVGCALAMNRLAWFVPCHRVIRQDGGLGGYRWGVELKHHLLLCEGRVQSTCPS